MRTVGIHRRAMPGLLREAVKLRQVEGTTT